MDLYSAGIVAFFAFGPLLLLHLALTPKAVSKDALDDRQNLWGGNAVVPLAILALVAYCMEYVFLMWVFVSLWVCLILIIIFQKTTGAADDQSILSVFAILSNHRKTNFVEFLKKHEECFVQGQKTGNYVPGVCNYYKLMADVIAISSGPFWHFVPMTKGFSRKQCHNQFHHTTCKFLDTKPSDNILEFGCGYGEIGRQVAKISGAKVTGLTMADEEIAEGNKRIITAGLQNQCKMEQGNYHDMKMFADCTFDKVFGIYTLKYSADLETAIKEFTRVLKPGGRFLSYEIIITDKYDKDNIEHKKIADRISYSTCMPPLWHAQDFRDAAKKAGLVMREEVDLCLPANEDPWYSSFTKTGVYQALSPDLAVGLCKLGEALHIVPKDAHIFLDNHVRHPLVDFVDGGRLGIINGALMMVWEKP